VRPHVLGDPERRESEVLLEWTLSSARLSNHSGDGRYGEMNSRRSHRVALARSDLRSLGRWFGLCAFAGVAAGLAGAAFVSAMGWVQAFTLGRLLGVWLDHPQCNAGFRRRAQSGGKASDSKWASVGSAQKAFQLG